MYKPNPQNVDQIWRTWCAAVDQDQIYQCREDIECPNGKFERGDLVLLQMISLRDNTDGRIWVTDFNAYGKRMISNHCDYFTKSELKFNISDVIILSLDDFERLFEPVQELNSLWENYWELQSHRENIWAGLSIGLFAVFVFSLFFSFFKQVALFSLITLFALILICFGGALVAKLADQHQMKTLLKPYISEEVKQWSK